MTTVEMKSLDCWCGLPFSMPTRLWDSCYENGQTFYCPLGHSNVVRERLSEKYRRERDRLQQRLAEKDDRIRSEREAREQAERSVSAYRGQVTKLKKRASAGVCPCCNRTFVNLQRHMSNKHPDYAETELAVIEGGKARG